MIVREGVGDVYAKTMTLDHKHARRLENHSVPVVAVYIYCVTNNVYIGNESEQSFLLNDLTYYDTYGAITLHYADLADIWIRAQATPASVRILGTICAGGWIATQRTG